MADEGKSKFMVLRNPEFFISLLKENKKFLDAANQLRYRASEVGMSRRVLSHWRQSSLMDIYGNNPEQIKVSFLGLFWLATAYELRQFGVSLETIKSIKEDLFQKTNLPIFEGYVILSSLHKDLDFFLLVSVDGRAVVGSRQEVDASESLGLLEENYIKINLNSVWNKIKKTKREMIRQPFSNSFLTIAEKSVIDVIRTGEYKEVVLRFKDGEVSHISKKSLIENPDAIKKVREIIASNDDFCDISLKKVNGKVVSLETVVMDKT